MLVVKFCLILFFNKQKNTFNLVLTIMNKEKKVNAWQIIAAVFQALAALFGSLKKSHDSAKADSDSAKADSDSASESDSKDVFQDPSANV